MLRWGTYFFRLKFRKNKNAIWRANNLDMCERDTYLHAYFGSSFTHIYASTFYVLYEVSENREIGFPNRSRTWVGLQRDNIHPHRFSFNLAVVMPLFHEIHYSTKKDIFTNHVLCILPQFTGPFRSQCLRFVKLRNIKYHWWWGGKLGRRKTWKKWDEKRPLSFKDFRNVKGIPSNKDEKTSNVIH